MALYYLPVLIRSDRYFVTRLEPGPDHTGLNGILSPEPDFNFVIHAEDRVMTPMLTIEDPGKIILNQMAPTGQQDIPLSECRLSMEKEDHGFTLVIRKDHGFSVEPFQDDPSGWRLDYSEESKRVLLGYYKQRVEQVSLLLRVKLLQGDGESCALHNASGW